MRVFVAVSGWSLLQDTLYRAGTVVAFEVRDTGIGIAADKQKLIFEAFQQADGTTSRKYGGTGLGLSISREIARILNGEIQLVSHLAQGSTFTLYLPLSYQEGRGGAGGAVATFTPLPLQSSTPEGMPSSPSHATLPLSPHLPRPPIPRGDPILPPSPPPDDREELQPGERVLLIVEDDINFASILLDLARQQGFKGIVASNGSMALAMAREFNPHAIMLDIRLPVVDGWTVLNHLKHDPNTRHIPVHIISGESEPQRGLQLGALAYLCKSRQPARH